MSKNLIPLIEKVEQSSSLQYLGESALKDKDSRFIGKLSGIAADSKSKTRNGRRYPIELWENVENSADFKEMMSTMTCFGEADHPSDESGRVDTSIKEIAMVLTDFKILKEAGEVNCNFGILDTPNGRILKTLCEAGCKIGVSSRGIGEEVNKNGEKIIDPDTYQFFGFDAVVMPAVIGARPNLTESVEISIEAKKSLSESFSKEIDNASSATELKSIKRLIETLNVPDLDPIKESINIKLSSFGSGEDISSKLESDIGELSKENEELKGIVESLKSKLSAKNIRLTEMRGVLRSTSSNSRDLSKKLQGLKISNSRLEESIVDGVEQISDFSSSYEDASNKIKKYESLNETLKNTIKSIRSENAKLLSENRKLEEQSKLIPILEGKVKMIPSLESQVRRVIELDKQVKRIPGLETKLSEAMTRLKDFEKSKRLTEDKHASEADILNKKLESLKIGFSNATSKYVKMRCMKEGIGLEEVLSQLPKSYTIEDVDKLVESISDRKRRLDKVPVSLKSRSALVLESSSGMSEADRQTMSILSGKNK